MNDRGIHICKSMLAWLRTGNGETPESCGRRGDHLVGDYYVAFNDMYRKEVDSLVGMACPGRCRKERPDTQGSAGDAPQMGKRDKEVRALWKKMNGWVYDGFDKT